MSDRSLCDAEEKDAIVRTLIAIFQQVDNKPSTAHALAPLYVDMKEGIRHRKEGNRDPCSCIRTCFSVWNRIAKNNCLGKHTPGMDGCMDKDFHRICKRKAQSELTVYWINNTLAKILHKNPVPPCRRSSKSKHKRMMVKEQMMKKEKGVRDKKVQDEEKPKDYIPSPPSPTSPVITEKTHTDLMKFNLDLDEPFDQMEMENLFNETDFMTSNQIHAEKTDLDFTKFMSMNFNTGPIFELDSFSNNDTPNNNPNNNNNNNNNNSIDSIDTISSELDQFFGLLPTHSPAVTDYIGDYFPTPYFPVGNDSEELDQILMSM